MKMPDRDTVERIRKEYPAGCRIVVDVMDDPQAPVPGTQGTVLAVDDTASVIPAWDTGGRLSVVYGVDACHKIRMEAEAKTTLGWYGKQQKEREATCPRCGCRMEGETARHALSRWADITVCDQCGMMESLEKAGIVDTVPMMQWAAITGPQNGEGKWNG